MNEIEMNEIEMNEIEVLIPHRAPFLYVDKIISFSTEEIIGIKVFPETDQFLRGSFPESCFVPGVILIEAVAQCGGAGIKKLGLADGLFGLANIENASFFKGVAYDTEFRMVVRNIKIAEKYIKQTGIGYVGNERCIEVTWTCIKFH